MVATVNTDTEIINLALDHLQEAAMLNANDSRYEVRVMRRNYRPITDRVLASHPWNCATRRRKIPADLDITEGTAFRFSYSKPPNCLRVLSVQDRGAFEGRKIPYVVEGDKILTNAAAPLALTYLERVSEYYYDPHVVDLIALSLAAKVAHVVTGKATMLETLDTLRKQSIFEAKQIDGLEGTMERPVDDAYDRARAGIEEY